MADRRPSQPVSRSIPLRDAERQRYADLVRALRDTLPCEPLAREANEPHFTFEGTGLRGKGPSLWLRANGGPSIDDPDPCLADPRLAHFVYQLWMERLPDEP